MLRKSFSAIFGLFCLVLLSGAADVQDPLRALPAGATMVASIDNTGLFVKNALSFLEASGLMDASPELAEIRRVLRGDSPQHAQAMGKLKALLEAVDAGKRLVFALYMVPVGSTSTGPGMLVYVPYRDKNSVESGLLEMVSGNTELSLNVSYHIPGYLALGINMDPGLLAAPDGNASLSLASYPDSTLSVWLDVAAFSGMFNAAIAQALSTFGDSSADQVPDGDAYNYYDDDSESYLDYEGYDGAEESGQDEEYADDEGYDAYGDYYGDDEFGTDSGSLKSSDYRAELDDEDSSPSASESPSQTAIQSLSAALPLVQELIDGLSTVEIALTVNSDRVWTSARLGLASGGLLDAMALSMASGDSKLPYLSYCDGNALLTGAWSSGTEWMTKFLEFFGAALASAEALDVGLEQQLALAGASGRNGAFSLDVSVSDALGRALQGDYPGAEEAARLVSEGLELSLYGVSQLKDRQAYRDAMKAQILEPGSVYRDMLLKFGVPALIGHQSGSEGGMPYDHYSAETDEWEYMDALAESLVARYGHISYAYSGDKAYMWLGQPAGAVDLARRDRATAQLSGVRGFSQLRAGAPADIKGFVYLSTARLAKLILQLKPDSGPLPFAYSELQGVMLWSSASRGSMGWGAGLGAGDIKALLALLNTSS